MVTGPSILVDLAICIRSGICAASAPGLVDQESDGTPMMLVRANGADADGVSMDELVALCPVGALSISPPASPSVESS